MENMKVLGYSLNGVAVYEHTQATHSHREDLNTEAISLITLEEGFPFFRGTVDMGRVIGEDHLVETDGYDFIVYARRGNRTGKSRFVLSRSAKQTTKVTIVACVDREAGSPTEGKWCLVTLFEGEPGEREPWDASLTTAEAKAKAEEFWERHALVPSEKDVQELNKMAPFELISYYAPQEPDDNCEHVDIATNMNALRDLCFKTKRTFPDGYTIRDKDGKMIDMH